MLISHASRDFFALMAVVAAVLTLSVTVLGIICFRNFGEGLSNYCKDGIEVSEPENSPRFPSSET